MSKRVNSKKKLIFFLGKLLIFYIKIKLIHESDGFKRCAASLIKLCNLKWDGMDSILLPS